MKKSFATRMREAMELRGIKQVDLVNTTGLTKSAISQYYSGKYEPKQKSIFLIAKALNVNEAWLMGLDVPMEKIRKAPEPSIKQIPILGHVAAGTPILAEENIDDYFTIDSRINADFALKVQGDSMIDAGIFEDDIVFIRQQQELQNGEIGAIFVDGEATLKKFYKDNGNIILQSENKLYSPMVFSNGNIKILGKLVAILNICN